MIAQALLIHVKHLLFPSDSYQNWNVSTKLRKTRQYQISWKSILWLPHCACRQWQKDGWLEMVKQIQTFLKLCWNILQMQQTKLLHFNNDLTLHCMCHHKKINLCTSFNVRYTKVCMKSAKFLSFLHNFYQPSP